MCRCIILAFAMFMSSSVSYYCLAGRLFELIDRKVGKESKRFQLTSHEVSALLQKNINRLRLRPESNIPGILAGFGPF